MSEELTKEIESKELLKNNLESKLNHYNEQKVAVKRQEADYSKDTNTLK